MTTAIDTQTLNLPASVDLLPDNSQYTNRFNLTSGSSGKVYLVAQRIFNPNTGKGGWWACDCPSYKFGRRGSKICKHMRDLGLPGNHEPFFVGQLAVGGHTGTVGVGVLRDSDRSKATKATKAPLRAISGGAPTKTARKAPVTPPPAVEAAPAPVALPAAPSVTGRLVPTGINMVDGKIIVEFDAKDSAAVFALLAKLSA